MQHGDAVLAHLPHSKKVPGSTPGFVLLFSVDKLVTPEDEPHHRNVISKFRNGVTLTDRCAVISVERVEQWI